MPSPSPTAGRHRARRPGRHRRPTASRAPTYFTAATLTAFVVSGVNVQGAIGASRTPTAAAADLDARHSVASATKHSVALSTKAADLRERIVEDRSLRASRARDAQADVDEKLATAAEAAEAAETARQAAEAAQRSAEIAAKKAVEAVRPRWGRPLHTYRLSAGFGRASYLWSNRHTGQDMSAPYGTPVRSVGDGRIVSSGWDGAYGQKLVVRHDDGTHSWYAHLSSYVRMSGRVKAGDIIGRVGSTGNSTGSHLHLEIRPNGGDPVEPLSWLRRHGVRI